MTPGRIQLFRDAEQKAEHVELQRRADEQHGRGQPAPRKHDASEPASGAKAHEEQIRRHFAECITDEE